MVLQMRVAHKTGMGVGVVLLIALVAGVIFVGYHFYTHSTKPFNFHYFKVRGQMSVSCPCQYNTSKILYIYI